MNARPSDIAFLKTRYPKGTRVELVEMDDVQAPPVGTKGTVIGVDDAGSIMVAWDNGSSLSCAFGADVVRPASAPAKKTDDRAIIRYAALIRDTLSGEEEDYTVCYPWIRSIAAATAFVRGQISYPWMIISVQEV